MKKKTSVGLESRVRGALDKILCQESNRDDIYLIQVLVFVLCQVASPIPNYFRDSWSILAQSIKVSQSNIFEFHEMMKYFLGMI
jgi:hypothetical protein